MSLNKYYWQFAGYALLFQVVLTIINVLLDISSSGTSIICILIPAMIVSNQFIKDNDRPPTAQESKALCNVSFILVWVISIAYFIICMLGLIIYFGGMDGLLFVIQEPSTALMLITDNKIKIDGTLGTIVALVFLVFSLIIYALLRYFYGGYAVKRYQKLSK